jgi:beta-N-acetylhexosaminidase
MRIAPTLLALVSFALPMSSPGIAASWLGLYSDASTTQSNSEIRGSHVLAQEAALRKKIGQMILIGFPGTIRTEEWPSRVSAMIRDGRIGGVILFGDNVIDPQQLRQLISSLEGKGESPPPMICVDQEGGEIQRLSPAKGFVGLPSAQRVAGMDFEAAVQLYSKSSRELASFGINCNFGPVVDLNINPENPAIGRLGRSYGTSPKKVVEFANLFIDAHRKAGVLTAAKHFPGHGSAVNDPHEQIVDITKTWRPVELEPFRSIINENTVDMVMVGHLIHPQFSDGDLPASLSKKAIQGELRGNLGYSGLIVSDDLDMSAIQDRYGTDAAAVLAIGAGADLVIVSNTKNPDPGIADRIVDAVVHAMRQGRISAEAIDQSYRRILQAKKKVTDRRAYIGMMTPFSTELQPTAR